MGCYKLHIENEPTLSVAYRKKAQKLLKNTLSYYPFGLQQKGYNDVISSNVNSVGNKIKTFQGQEIHDELGLDWFEFKYRFYNPSNSTPSITLFSEKL